MRYLDVMVDLIANHHTVSTRTPIVQSSFMILFIGAADRASHCMLSSRIDGVADRVIRAAE